MGGAPKKRAVEGKRTPHRRTHQEQGNCLKLNDTPEDSVGMCGERLFTTRVYTVGVHQKRVSRTDDGPRKSAGLKKKRVCRGHVGKAEEHTRVWWTNKKGD